jgi:ATP-binding cassette subfamily B protein
MKHLARLWPYARRHAAAYALGLLLVVGATVCGVLVPLQVKRTIDHLDRTPTRNFIWTAAAVIAGLAIARGALIASGRHLILRASRRVEFEFRNDVYHRLERLPAKFFDTHPTGEITSRVINDLDGARMMIGIGVMASASTGLLLLSSVAAMLALRPGLALLCLAPLALISAVMALMGARTHDLSLAVQDQLGLLSGRAQENFTGARVVRAFAQEEAETSRYRGLCDEYLNRNVRLARWRTGGWAAILILMEGALLVTLYAGGSGLVDGSFTKGELAAFVAYQFGLVWPMIAIGWVVNIVQRGLACLNRLADILDAPLAPAPEPPASPAQLRGAIEARDLRFRYADDRPPALDGVSFRIEPGQRVAVVGRTGSGKSTLVSLLLRLYPAPPGALLVDGRDVNEIPAGELRAAIGAVPQDLFLFSDTLRANVAFGGSDDVDEAVRLSRLEADLDQFPGGLDQVIGERGVTLSGGQKQRAALARALVRRPRILVLDDALSSVDARTEQEIRERLDPFLKGRTSLIVTHRLSMTADADLILVLEDGRLVESGRHEDLVARKGVYAALWETQKAVEELAKA